MAECLENAQGTFFKKQKNLLPLDLVLRISQSLTHINLVNPHTILKSVSIFRNLKQPPGSFVVNRLQFSRM